jgi:hypothetical protein
MAITWKKRVRNEDGTETMVDDGTSHEGLVVMGNFYREERVMSDVYANVAYCQVLDPETGEAKEMYLHACFECEGRFGTATADLDPQVRADLEKRQAEAAAKAEAARKVWQAERREREAEEACQEPKMGAPARVVKGRKVPKGTEGVIFWMGSGNYGPRVGLKDAQGTAHWTAESNVVRVCDKPEGMTWVEYRRQERNRQPHKGCMATVTSGPDKGFTGYVFWMGKGRCGLKLDPTDRDADPVWAAEADVQRLNEDEVEAAKAAAEKAAKAAAEAEKAVAAKAETERQAKLDALAEQVPF